MLGLDINTIIVLTIVYVVGSIILMRWLEISPLPFVLAYFVWWLVYLVLLLLFLVI